MSQESSGNFHLEYDNLASMKMKSPHLKDESNIVWLENSRQFPYVRETVECMPFRSRFSMSEWKNPKRKKLIAYSEISLGATSTGHDGFYRRFWYVMSPNDPFEGSHSPVEAVKPSSISPRKESEEGRE